MAEIIIHNGETSTGLVANSGDIIIIEAGGTLVEGVINDGGVLSATYGAVAENLTAATGATVELTGAAKTSGLMLTGANTNIAEGTLYYQGAAITGTVTNGTISNLDGVYRVCIGAGISASDPVVGGETTLGVRVYAQENAIVSGGSITTSGNIGLLDTAYGNGVTVGGAGVTKANYNTFDNAIAENTIVSEGGQFTVRYKADNTTVNAGGNMIVSNLGIADGIALSGTLNVSNGGRAENVDAVAGAAVNVSNGGVADHVTMNGGALTVSKGGVVYDLTANPGTTLTISGGVSGGVLVGHSGASTAPWLHYGAFINDVTLRTDVTYYSPQNYAWIRLGNTGATDVAYGSNIKVESAGKFQVNNGYAENISATTYGGAIVYNNDQSGKGGASASRIFVSNHGVASVYTRPGVAVNALMEEVWIGNGGLAKVGKGEGDGSGGEMRDAILNPGGSMTVCNNGVAQLDDHPWIDKSHLVINTGGTVTSAHNYEIYYGTEEEGVKARAKGPQVGWALNADSAVIYDGATISGGQVASGATFVMKGGWVSGASFDSGATVRIQGGTVLDIAAVRLSATGLLHISGAVVSGGYIAGDGDRHTTGSATFLATDDAVLRDVKITNVANVSKSNVVWGMMGDTSAAGTGSADAYNCTVEKGARLQMYHGTAYDTTIDTGAMFNIAWGSAVRTTISGGAYNGAGEGARMILHYAAGRVYDTTVGSGGTMTISNGRASDTTVESGGSLTVVGGVASGLVVESGARFYMTGGTVSGATFRMTVGSGLGSFTGGTIYDLTVEGPASATTRKFYVANNAVVSGGLVRTDAADHGLEFYVSGGAKIYDVTFTTDVIDATGNINYTRLGWAAGNVGYAYDCTVQSGAKLQMNNGRVYNTTVKDGGCVTVWGYTTDGAYAENTSVFGNGLNTYTYGGSKYGAVVFVSAQAGNSAVMSGAFIGSGGYIDINQSGAVMNVLVNSGGSMRLNHATAQALVDYNPFIDQYTAALIRKNYAAAVVTYQTEDERAYKVYYGATDGKTGLIFRTNETEYDNFNVEVGHSMHIYEGQALNTFVQSGGVLSLGGANATATVDYNPWGSGATIINDKGGTVTSQTEAQRAYNIYYATETEGVISRANEADGTTIGAGISARILQGAVIEDLTLSGGKILLSSGAVVRGLTVSDGGYVTLDKAVSAGDKNYGASAYDVTLGKGGGMYFQSGNYLSNVTIESGGSLNVYHFGQIHNAVISNGGQIELRTNGIATSNLRGGVVLDLAGNNTANRYMVTRNFTYISGAVIKANGEVADSTYYICSNAGTEATANAFKLDIGGGNVYDTNATATEFFDAANGLVYSRTRNQIDTTTNYDLRLETTISDRKLATVDTAAAVATSGETLNGSDRGARWTENTTYGDTVYVAEGLTTGNAWLDIDGATVEKALYGAAAGQTFDGAVNVKLTTGSIRNLAVGAAAGGTVANANFTMAGGELAGNAYAGGMGNVTDAVSATIAGGELATGKNFYAGALWNKLSSATSVGEVNLTVKAGTIKGNVYGASAVKTGAIETADNDAAKHTVGDVTFTLAGGTAADAEFCAFAGGYATGTDSTLLASVYNVANVNATISGGTWGDAADARGGRGVFGGVFASGVKATAQNVSITVEGGTVANVFGGGWAQKGGTSTVESVSIVVTGGTVANIFGCGMHSVQGNSTTSVGDVSITLAGGDVTDNVFARGLIDGDAVTGDVSVTVTGSTDYGCGFYGFSRTAGESDKAELFFDNYTGTISGEINGFKEIALSGDTAMTFADAANISNTAWLFDATERTDASAVFATCGTADFADATITLSLAEEPVRSDWSIFAGGAETAYGEFDVQVGGVTIAEALKLDDQIASGDYAGWGFTVEESVLKFKNLA